MIWWCCCGVRGRGGVIGGVGVLVGVGFVIKDGWVCEMGCGGEGVRRVIVIGWMYGGYKN